MNQSSRIKFAVERVLGNSVFMIPRSDWEHLVHSDGRVTDLEEADLAMGGAKKSAVVVACAASGIANPVPGIDFVRLDPKDAPYQYNTDHYSVLEKLPNHPEFERILKVARIDFTPQLKQALTENVFVVGPEKLGNHWAKEIPDYIAKAEKKG